MDQTQGDWGRSVQCRMCNPFTEDIFKKKKKKETRSQQIAATKQTVAPTIYLFIFTHTSVSEHKMGASTSVLPCLCKYRWRHLNT